MMQNLQIEKRTELKEGAEVYLAVRNWEKFQQYKDRDPKWIKLHRCLLGDYEFSQLSDQAKAHLIQIWLIAAETGNQVPNDADWIARRIAATTPVDLYALITAGFLVERTDTPGVSVRSTEEPRTDLYKSVLRAEQSRAEREKKREEQQQAAAANGFAAAAAALNGFGTEKQKSSFDRKTIESFLTATKNHVRNPGGLATKLLRTGEEDLLIGQWQDRQALKAMPRPAPATLSAWEQAEAERELLALAEEMGLEWLHRMKSNFEEGDETSSPVYKRIRDLIAEREEENRRCYVELFYRRKHED